MLSQEVEETKEEKIERERKEREAEQQVRQKRLTFGSACGRGAALAWTVLTRSMGAAARQGPGQRDGSPCLAHADHQPSF